MKRFSKPILFLLAVLLLFSAVPAAADGLVCFVYAFDSINDLVEIYVAEKGQHALTFVIDASACTGMTQDEIQSTVVRTLYRNCREGYSLSVTPETDGSTYVYVTDLYLRDGIRMYRSIDLTPDEQRCRDEIQAVVDGLLRQYPANSLALEQAIYDDICARLTYESFDTGAGSPERTRCTSAYYAFRSGRGNCQAYADLFRMMASMAGFSAEHICGDADGEAHDWNLLYLPYDPDNPDRGVVCVMVDVTYGDTHSNDWPFPNHYYMNFGTDRGLPRSWPRRTNIAGLCETTDDTYTYYRNWDEKTGYVTGDLTDAVQYCIWKAEKGERFAEVLIKGKTIDDLSTYDKAILNAVNRSGHKASWNYWYYTMDGNTVLRMRWNSFS